MIWTPKERIAQTIVLGVLGLLALSMIRNWSRELPIEEQKIYLPIVMGLLSIASFILGRASNK